MADEKEESFVVGRVSIDLEWCLEGWWVTEAGELRANCKSPFHDGRLSFVVDTRPSVVFQAVEYLGRLVEIRSGLRPGARYLEEVKERLLEAFRGPAKVQDDLRENQHVISLSEPAGEITSSVWPSE